MSFTSSHTRDQTVLELCRELPWRNITNPAWGAWIPSPPLLLYHLHMYLWCPVNYCLITKHPPLCLLHSHPLGLSPSPTTQGGNSGTPACHGLWPFSVALNTYFFSVRNLIRISVLLFVLLNLRYVILLQPGVDCCPRLFVLCFSFIM